MSTIEQRGAIARTAASVPLPTRTVRIALAGCGTVGGALLRLLQDRADAIRCAHQLRFEVVRVLVRDRSKPRALVLPGNVLTADLDAFLAAGADLVVEAIGGVDPAGRIARHALARGRGFVTANKALIAACGDELAALARAHAAPLAFEAAVAGGVPVIRVLRESLEQTGVSAIRGILNGTTNYILTRMGAGVPFAVALAEAQALGFAEADPTRDLSGQDAADKIAILAWQAFGTHPGRLQVHCSGLLPDPDRIVADAMAAGGVARLIAECERLPEGVIASVEPVIVAPDADLARVPAEENLVAVVTGSSGTIRLAGPGAGGGATASAVLSDMLRAAPAPAAVGQDAPRGAPDTRAHRWLISVLGGGAARRALLRAAEQAQVDVEELCGTGEDGSVRVLTGPLARTRAGLLVGAPGVAGFRPRMLRNAVAS